MELSAARCVHRGDEVLGAGPPARNGLDGLREVKTNSRRSFMIQTSLAHCYTFRHNRDSTISGWLSPCVRCWIAPGWWNWQTHRT
jgi:hypothetical protein